MTCAACGDSGYVTKYTAVNLSEQERNERLLRGEFEVSFCIECDAGNRRAVDWLDVSMQEVIDGMILFGKKP